MLRRTRLYIVHPNTWEQQTRWQRLKARWLLFRKRARLSINKHAIEGNIYVLNTRQLYKPIKVTWTPDDQLTAVSQRIQTQLYYSNPTSQADFTRITNLS